MFIRRTFVAGLVAIAALTAAAPSQAASLYLNFGQGGAQLAFHEGGPGRHHRDRDDRWGRPGDHGGWNRTLSPQEIRRVLRQSGYRNIRYLDRQGRIYQVRAIDYRGRRVGLVVSARSGAVLNSYRL